MTGEYQTSIYYVKVIIERLLIWECGLYFLKQAPLYFVTADLAFFESRSPDRGLVENLKKDVSEIANKFAIYPSLYKCLSDLTIDRPDLQERQYIPLLVPEISVLLKDSCDSIRIFVGDLQLAESNIKGFEMEKPEELAIKFHIIFSAERIKYDNGISISGTLHVFGAAVANRSSKSISKSHIHHVYFSSPQMEDGKVWLRVSGELGEQGPLPVPNPHLWVRQNTSDREVWVGEHADTVTSLFF